TARRRAEDASHQRIEIERERALAAQAERERELQAEQARAALEAIRAQRPLGERLLEARCTQCHALVVLEGAARSALAWRLTVERMRFWHGAQVTTDETSVIAKHLAETRPGPWGTTDFVATAALVSMLALPVLGLRARKKGGNR
ncbi:MAG: hypothetical protein ACK4XK_10255, partial [Casimicrobiaceae bacterium]